MKASDYIADFLAKRGVSAVFELSGGMITHILDSLNRDGRTKIVSMHHEQGAAFAAEGAGRITGTPSVAMATSGPGATNLLTGIGSCYFDSIPALFLTGQVNLHEQKNSRPIRQLGFQETDIVSMARPITKGAWMVRSAAEIPAALDDAYRLASTGRPGPVLLDIPMNVQSGAVDAPPSGGGAFESCPAIDPRHIDVLRDAILVAKRPLIVAGGGIRSAGAIENFRRFVTAVGIPVVHSLMGTDLLSYNHPANVGMIGSYGNRWANHAISAADFLLVLGSRLDVRQTGAQSEAFKGNRPIFHVDCESGEINNRVVGCYGITSHLNPALETLSLELSDIGDRIFDNTSDWRQSILELRKRFPDVGELAGVDGINPNIFMHSLSRNAPVAAYCVDVGQHQMWAAQSLELSEKQRFLTTGGMGAMGFALPAAIGAATCLNGAAVTVVAGDGSFQCNIQELQTVVRLGLNIKMVIINNGCHGMVRQFQESYFGGRYQSTMWGYSAPDFAMVANSYGIPARTVASPNEINDAIGWLNHGEDGPALLQVMVPSSTNVFPKLAFGRGMDEMEPDVRPTEMEST